MATWPPHRGRLRPTLTRLQAPDFPSASSASHKIVPHLITPAKDSCRLELGAVTQEQPGDPGQRTPGFTHLRMSPVYGGGGALCRLSSDWSFWVVAPVPSLCAPQCHCHGCHLQSVYIYSMEVWMLCVTHSWVAEACCWCDHWIFMYSQHGDSGHIAFFGGGRWECGHLWSRPAQ